MPRFSVIIPSKTRSNLDACVPAVRDAGETCQIIIVNDGIEWEDANTKGDPFDRIRLDEFIIDGASPFIFSRNCNLGINAAGLDDVVLLNDDAILKTPCGFSLLKRTADEYPEFGIISATTNVAGNPLQEPHGVGLRFAEGSIAFVCVYIPRRTIEAVGLMDERFGGNMPDGRRIYGFCDNDYCRRVRDAGMKVGIHDGCFVDHGSLRSSFRGDPYAAGDISAGAELYKAKWGDLN